jgi:hypothetical protein
MPWFYMYKHLLPIREISEGISAYLDIEKPHPCTCIINLIRERATTREIGAIEVRQVDDGDVGEVARDNPFLDVEVAEMRFYGCHRSSFAVAGGLLRG